jgi:hypothetical protein
MQNHHVVQSPIRNPKPGEPQPMQNTGSKAFPQNTGSQVNQRVEPDGN